MKIPLDQLYAETNKEDGVVINVSSLIWSRSCLTKKVSFMLEKWSSM